VTGPLPVHAQPRGCQRRFHCRHELLHVAGRRAEEVEISRGSIDNLQNDESGATRQREPVGFGQLHDHASYPLLQRGQHATATPRRRASQRAHA
jgi:hypothetical protein